MGEKKIDFSALDWESSPLGSRVKAFVSGTSQIRLVEIVRADGEAQWCQSGHIGYVIEGELEIEFKNETVRYKQGDGLFIASGESAEHRPRPLTERVRLFLVEEV